jgi:hypothetical protein
MGILKETYFYSIDKSSAKRSNYKAHSTISKVESQSKENSRG